MYAKDFFNSLMKTGWVCNRPDERLGLCYKAGIPDKVWEAFREFEAMHAWQDLQHLHAEAGLPYKAYEEVPGGRNYILPEMVPEEIAPGYFRFVAENPEWAAMLAADEYDGYDDDDDDDDEDGDARG